MKGMIDNPKRALVLAGGGVKIALQAGVQWGLDLEKIRSNGREATLNVYNFSHQELRPVIAPRFTEDYLVASASLSLWFPSMRIDRNTYIDAILNIC